jgi:hypothetical protein
MTKLFQLIYSATLNNKLEENLNYSLIKGIVSRSYCAHRGRLVSSIRLRRIFKVGIRTARAIHTNITSHCDVRASMGLTHYSYNCNSRSCADWFGSEFWQEGGLKGKSEMVYTRYSSGIAAIRSTSLGTPLNLCFFAALDFRPIRFKVASLSDLCALINSWITSLQHWINLCCWIWSSILIVKKKENSSKVIHSFYL